MLIIKNSDLLLLSRAPAGHCVEHLGLNNGLLFAQIKWNRTKVDLVSTEKNIHFCLSIKENVAQHMAASDGKMFSSREDT